MRTILPIALALAASPSALALTTSGYVTNVTLANSSYTDDYACTIQISSTPTATTGTTFRVDDVTGRFDGTCSYATLAMYFDDAFTLAYTSSGSNNWITGITDGRSSDTYYYRTGTYASSTYEHHCQAYMSTSSGWVWANVDDDNPEEHVTCAALGLLHFLPAGTGGFTVSRATSGEINTLQMSF